LDLTNAPFDRQDEKQLPSAGACSRCPRQTGSNPLLRGISGNKSGLLPVCLGQREHAPADGSCFSSCRSNGAFVRSRWISRAIHPRSSRTVTASARLSLRTAEAFRWCGKHSCKARRWSPGCFRALRVLRRGSVVLRPQARTCLSRLANISKRAFVAACYRERG